MPKKESIEKKLEYLGLNLEKIPQKLKKVKSLEFKPSKYNDEKQYKQYRYINIKDIEILLSPTNRLDDISEKYKKASPLAEYLDNKKEKNLIKYTTFLNMLKQFKIEDVEKIEKEQKNLNKKIPFKVKYESNYLWQIYYSQNTDTYFMIVPTEDTDYSTFFYLLKKKIEGDSQEKIFVPIRGVEYSSEYLKKSQFEDITNYLWLFTKDWPLVYEVYDKKENLSIRIIGETEVYEKIKSYYRIKLDNKEDAVKFYKLLKAMFILQTEVPHYFKFRTDISKSGGIDFYLEDKKIVYEEIPKWLKEEHAIGIERIKIAEELVEENSKKLAILKEEIAIKEVEYLAKEKQISTFLECKKSFFGRFKYFFKYNKKRNKEYSKEQIEEKEEENNNKKEDIKKETKDKSNYTIEELIEVYKEFEKLENKLKNLYMDVNALKLKKKNMLKKIENATNFIEEIDKHKKSIFEFWRYSNKDEMNTLPEGEEEEINIVKKVTKVFDYEEDFESFGKMMDKMQRKLLTEKEKNAIFITTTDLLNILNKVRKNEVVPKEITTKLKELKEEAVEQKTLMEDEFDIFGGMLKDSLKTSKIKEKKHRENPKDKFSILEINKDTKQLGFRLSLEKIVEDIRIALTKIVIPEDISIYKALNEEKLSNKTLSIFDINAENEIKNAIKSGNGKINFYKFNLKRGVNAISYTNCIFYDNYNKTLPIGQDISSNIMVDLSKLKLKPKKKTSFKVVHYENEKDDFSKVGLKIVNVFEYDLKD